MKLETPLHKVQGLGAAHAGTGHFWHQRVTAVALIPLGLWFIVAMLGLAGAGEAAATGFLERPWNAILMGAFIIVLLYHLFLGLQSVYDDYVQPPGLKIFSLIATAAAIIAVGAASFVALIRLAV